MTIAFPSSKLFEPGTTGWTVEDLNDPAVERQWSQGRYEIVEGVLTKMPPAYFDASRALGGLITVLVGHIAREGIKFELAPEADLVLGNSRVAIADAIFMSPADIEKQRKATVRRKPKGVILGRIVVPPTLIIESVSIDHELHDLDTKRRWYAEFRVPNYWILNAYERTLTCLALDHGVYKTDEAGKGRAILSPSLFPGLKIALHQLWVY